MTKHKTVRKFGSRDEVLGISGHLYKVLLQGTLGAHPENDQHSSVCIGLQKTFKRYSVLR